MNIFSVVDGPLAPPAERISLLRGDLHGTVRVRGDGAIKRGIKVPPKGNEQVRLDDAGSRIHANRHPTVVAYWEDLDASAE